MQLACHQCDKRSCGSKPLPPCSGVMLCTVSGKDIIAHIESGQCPLGRFDGVQHQPFTPKPVAEWPLSARIIAKLRGPEDKGLGDTLARNLSYIGADSMASAYEWLTGHDCGCGDRQGKLNRMFSYPEQIKA